MCARVVASAGKNTIRAGCRPGGGVEGRTLTTDAPPPNTNRSRNTESSAAAAAAAQQSVVGEYWVGVSTVVYYPSGIAVVASSLFHRCTCSSLTRLRFRLLCPFSFWRHPVIVPSRFFVTYPHGSSPFDRTVIIINRPYPVHVVNTVRFLINKHTCLPASKTSSARLGWPSVGIR